MTSYSPVGQLTGVFLKNYSLGDKIPWIYIIASLSSKIIFAGECFEDGGLLSTLAVHLGTAGQSAMQVKALELGLDRPSSPHVIVAARLPFGSDPAEFDGASSSVRDQCLATLQAKIAEKFIPARTGWTDLTIVNGISSRNGSAIDRSCEAIFNNYINIIDSMSAISRAVPLHLVVLDPYPVNSGESDTLEAVLSEIEVNLHGLVVGKLQSIHGASWWSKGVPLEIRTGCVSRRELDGGDHSISPDAYMMFIDLSSIIKYNWTSFSTIMEKVAGRQGKDNGTSWISELNELRKIAAHPIRGKYVKPPVGSFERVIDLRSKLNEAITKLSTENP